MILRPSVAMRGVHIMWSFCAAGLVLLAGLAIVDARLVPIGSLVAGGFLGLALSVPVLTMRCEFGPDSVRVRNFFRSHTFLWSDLVSIELRYAPFLLFQGPWGRLPVCRLRSGEEIEIRALVHMRKRKAHALVALLEQKAAQYGFATDIDPIALTR